MAEKKITKKEMFAEIGAYLKGMHTHVSVDEMYEFLRGEIIALDKKAVKAKSTPTKGQKENEIFKNEILNYLTCCEKPQTITDIINGCETCNSLTNQKVTALVTALAKENKVVRSLGEKRRPQYEIACGDDANQYLDREITV